MSIIYQHRINRSDLTRNPTVLYLFGDNDMRWGRGGQAGEMRGEPNAVGIRTKRRPDNIPGAFWTDDTYEENCQKIDNDLAPIREFLRLGGVVVVPAWGLGTGRARLHETAPKTFEYLTTSLKILETSVCAPASPPPHSGKDAGCTP